MAAKLLYRDAQGRDAAVDLPEVGAFLGRAVECIVRTDDAMVSRRNCKISVQGGRWSVEDLNSANGTFINERRIQRDPLSHGDVIRCGSLQVRFVEVPDVGAGSGIQRASIPPQPPAQQSLQPPADGAAKITSSPSPGRDSQAPGSPRETAGAKESDENRALGNKESGEAVVQAKVAELQKIQEEFKKLSAELEAAVSAAAESKTERDQAVAKLETTEQEIKRLRNESAAAKEAIDKLRRTAKQNEEELGAENRVNEELRHELKAAKEQLGLGKSLEGDLRSQLEVKERQLASANDDVRRAKQQTDSLNQKLVELSRARDEQVRAINSQRGDVDHLRDILKERERMLEEQRVGLINQESQLKDVRKRAEDLEKEFSQARGERDNLRERFGRAQVQTEELRAELDRMHALLAGQQDGGEQLLMLSRENSALRDELAKANEEIGKQHDQLAKLTADFAEVSKQRDRLGEERKNAQAKLQSAVSDAVQQVTTELKTRHEAEKQKLIAERDAAVKEQKEASARAAEHSDNSAQQQQDVRAAREERDSLRGKVAELEFQLQAAQTAATAAPVATAANQQAEQQLAEMKHVATDAYDGINDSLSELRMSIVLAQETFNKMERTLPDKEVG
ncbi:MAG TPA: FHA domain-containing protein, partial [Pseudomonadota bacterium]|nr:FHA domain-containing protein [Pseudomonadota bacterium]